jgi:hypothetical protein
MHVAVSIYRFGRFEFGGCVVKTPPNSALGKPAGCPIVELKAAANGDATGSSYYFLHGSGAARFERVRKSTAKN